MSNKLTSEQIKELFDGKAAADVTNCTAESPWFVHPAMPWENIKWHLGARLADVMIPVYDRRYDGLRDGEYDPVLETKWRLKWMADLSDERLQRRVNEVGEVNMRYQRANNELREQNENLQAECDGLRAELHAIYGEKL